MPKFNSLVLRVGFATDYTDATVSSADSVRNHRNSPTDTKMTDGTGAYQANAEYRGSRTLLTNTNETLDLYGGLVDKLGNTLNFTKIKAIHLRNPRANTTALTYKGHSSNGFLGPMGAATHTIAIAPGGEMIITNPDGGWAVTNGSVDSINIANAAGATNNYELHLIGTV